MSDHDFEKQVRQKLDDLRITPSAASWENIEHNIRAVRRRKAPVLWLSLLLLAVTVGGYWIYDNSEREKIVTSENIKVLPSYKAASGSNAVPYDNRERVNGESNQNISVTEVKRGKELLKSSTNKRSIANDRNNTSSPFKPANGLQPANGNAKHFESLGVNEIPDPRAENNISTTQITDHTNGTTGSEQLRLHPLKMSPTTYDYNKVGNLFSGLSSVEIPGLIKSPFNNVTPEKKWSFGVSGFAGMTTMNDGNLFNLGKTKVADLTRSSAPVNAFAPSYSPSTISPGFSYAAGLFVKRTLNKRFSLSSGLNYLHLNTKHNVGKRIYGTFAVNVGNSRYQFVNNAFVIAQGETKNYTNTYHFIEIPLILNTKLNKWARNPVYWNSGVAYSRLLSSNSLLFDGSSGVYYSNDKLLKKSHASLITGFDITLLSKTKTPLSVGPLVRYNISKLLNENIPENKNFLSLGLDVKLFLR